MFFQHKIKKKKGFSLIEMILVLGISSLAFIALLASEKRKAEVLKAESAGEQIAEIGQALNSYIAREGGHLITNVFGAEGIGTTASYRIIPITVLQGQTQAGTPTYNGRVLLPQTFNASNAFGGTYSIVVKKQYGSLSGFVIYNQPVTDNGEVRYDWLGVAVKKAGHQAGMSFLSNNITGMNGGWQISAADTNGLSNNPGLLFYRTAYTQSMDDTYLRLDGMFPMRGNLNMGNYNINNVTAIRVNDFITAYTGNFNEVNTSRVFSDVIENTNTIRTPNLQSGYIRNMGEIRTKNIQGYSTTTPPPGIPADSTNSMSRGFPATVDFAEFSYMAANQGFYTNIINNPTMPGGAAGLDCNTGQCDVVIGSPGNPNLRGNLYVKDINLGAGANVNGGGSRAINNWLSKRLPKYVSHGMQAITPISNGAAQTVTPPPPEHCTAVGGTNRIEIIPQTVTFGGTVLGTLAFTVTSTSPTSYTLTLNQEQYVSSGFHMSVTGTGPWQVSLTSIRSTYDNPATFVFNALAHVYCDFG